MIGLSFPEDKPRPERERPLSPMTYVVTWIDKATSSDDPYKVRQEDWKGIAFIGCLDKANAFIRWMDAKDTFRIALFGNIDPTQLHRSLDQIKEAAYQLQKYNSQ